MLLWVFFAALLKATSRTWVESGRERHSTPSRKHYLEVSSLLRLPCYLFFFKLSIPTLAAYVAGHISSCSIDKYTPVQLWWQQDDFEVSLAASEAYNTFIITRIGACPCYRWHSAFVNERRYTAKWEQWSILKNSGSIIFYAPGRSSNWQKIGRLQIWNG